mmetsp:Transcript_6920/g.12271  ORF Transcript_6920/g.12271 Transcript_6920/m.12271 type:complete len:249 (-) Transcript_6920:31-777(-)
MAMEESKQAPLAFPSPRGKDRRQHEREVAEVWVQYQKERAARAREDRKRRLEELKNSPGLQVRSRRAQRAMLAVCPAEDLELFEKYGHKIRVPPIPYTPRRPQHGDDSQESSVSASRARLPGVQASGSGSGRRRGPSASQHRHAGALSTSSQVPVRKKEEPHPDIGSTLSPRKALLRQVQSDILKKTEVVFYKGCMRHHFRNILDAVEAKFTDADAKQRRVLLNISKPLTSSEIKHYMRHASAQNGLA